MGKHFVMVIFLIFGTACQAQPADTTALRMGAERLEVYLEMLQGKQVGLFVNHTSLVGTTHLTDTLVSLGIPIKRVFSAEHGFLGNKPDGESISGEQHGDWELVSLYGNTKRPSDAHLQDLDVLVIDIQDVGVRCYTYASAMTYLMEACAKNGVPVIILDRPNPNGGYIDGPLLDERFESYIGLHPIPLVHGLTLGELALMINGEGWLETNEKCDLQVIPVANWDHQMKYVLPVPPSPNLPNQRAIVLYPSLVLFEGTVVSIGRGTDYPFQVLGHPDFAIGSYTFTPTPNEGSKFPPLENQQCFGINLTEGEMKHEVNLSYLLGFYQYLSSQTDIPFFNDYFVKLAGTDSLQQQIEAGWTEEAIRQSWEADLTAFREVRRKYLIYGE